VSSGPILALWSLCPRMPAGRAPRDRGEA
jgi:hypothetical protein